jgi:hypothetical protein
VTKKLLVLLEAETPLPVFLLPFHLIAIWVTTAMSEGRGLMNESSCSFSMTEFVTKVSMKVTLMALFKVGHFTTKKNTYNNIGKCCCPE